MIYHCGLFYTLCDRLQFLFGVGMLDIVKRGG